LRQETDRVPLLSRPFAAILFALSAVILAAAALLAWKRALSGRANLVTGEARWIWLTLDFPEPRTLHFQASKEFRLDSAPANAPVKLYVEPRGSLTVNGKSFGSADQKPGSPLRVFDAAPALAAGDNRLVIEAESATGAGGILFCLDLPGGRRIVSDSSWRVRSTGDAESRPAAVWGRPPMYPWGYPRLP
jgi:hypothetical protein